MASFIIRRLLYSLIVLLIASFVAFAGVRAAFDPLAKFAKGDWGTSDSTRESVATMIQRSMGKTLQLIIPGIIISLVAAISLGVYSAVKQYSVGDYVFTTASFIGIAMPPFWFGLLAIEFLAIRSKSLLGLKQNPFFFVGLHSGNGNGFNADYARHLVLPVLTLTVQLIAGWSRFQRAAMLDVLSADYVRTAKAKGVPRRRVIMHHAFRNALIPLVTVVALDAGALFGGLIITEQIFSIAGMGRLFVNSLTNGDAPVLAAWTIVAASFVIIFNLIADVAYGVLDPRVRLS